MALELMCAFGVVTARLSRSRGVSPRYAGREGRLRACYIKPPD
ncbi:replication protein RepA4 [Salmonella enterica]|nr:replication protein RepA4 [Salmonella enterica]EDG0446542.1 replication protein RepA4 [Salmonella enterica subsp. enterica serovar Newport]EDR1639280.1 replication protein RepA4 [Salmonella enterica subsp. enterica serovar Saintpaul]EEJ3115484.1 replication protein RepA4 [Salmonella enterica subsp. enterica serovar Javiana]EAS7511159.1 replication protein RepA4 [Salmonella enterica]